MKWMTTGLAVVVMLGLAMADVSACTASQMLDRGEGVRDTPEYDTVVDVVIDTWVGEDGWNESAPIEAAVGTILSEDIVMGQDLDMTRDSDVRTLLGRDSGYWDPRQGVTTVHGKGTKFISVGGEFLTTGHTIGDHAWLHGEEYHRDLVEPGDDYEPWDPTGGDGESTPDIDHAG
jgi:hypothetical protein